MPSTSTCGISAACSPHLEAQAHSRRPRAALRNPSSLCKRHVLAGESHEGAPNPPSPRSKDPQSALSASRGRTLLVLQVAARRCKTQRPRRHCGGIACTTSRSETKKRLMKAVLGSRPHWQRGACRTSETGTGHPTRGLYLSVLSCEPFRIIRQAKPVARDGIGRRSYYRGRRLFASLHHSLVLIIAVPILPTQPVAAPHAAPPLCSHAESLSGKAE